MIPEFVDINGVWNSLPPGIYDASLQEVELSFATNETRKTQYDGFRRGLRSLRNAGCKIVYLDGRFVTDKPRPGDFDACLENIGVDYNKLDPVLLDFSHKRRRQKQKYGGEFFPSSVKADGSWTFLEYFQIDKYTGKKKGIIRIRLS